MNSVKTEDAPCCKLAAGRNVEVMSEPGESIDKIDLSGLQLMPDWVVSLDSAPKPVIRSYDEEEEQPRGRQAGPRSNWGKDGGRGREGFGGRGGDRRDAGPRRDGGGGPDRRERREGGRDRDRDRGRGRDQDRGQRDREARHEAPPAGVTALVKPSPHAVEALVLQIKKSGRAFGLFDVAKIVLAGRERFVVEFAVEPDATVQLFRCRPDGSLWLSKEQAMRHFLEQGNLESIYLVENKEVEPPKGEFRAVAVCGMSGVILGPPNHHSFQNAVVRLYKRRFANMQFERFKSRIKTETNEELVAKWKEAESKVTHYLYPKEVAEGETQTRLESIEALERHAMTQLSDEIVQKVNKASVPGNIPGNHLAPGLLTLLRQTVEPLRTGPFPLVKVLCGQLEAKGLRIFKRHGKKLFVCKSRPRAIDPSVNLSESIRRITERVTTSPGVLVKDLVAAIAPRAPGVELAQGEYTPEETSVLSDLHWLIDEGYIIEYASSALFLGVQPSENAAPKGKPKGKRKGDSDVDPGADAGVAESVDEVVENIADESVEEIADESAAEIADESVEEIADESAAEIADESVAEIADEPVAEIADEPVAESADESVVEIADESVAEIADEPVVEIADESVAEIADESVVEIADESVVEIADESVVEIADESVVEIADESVAEIADESVAEIADEAVAEIADEAVAEIANETPDASGLNVEEGDVAEEILSKAAEN